MISKAINLKLIDFYGREECGIFAVMANYFIAWFGWAMSCSFGCWVD